jgi:CubicO group peptidase (beta-lactamase class C family)
VDDVLAAAVSANVVPGAVALITSASSTLYQGACGVCNAAAGAPIATDTVFRIASMTKTITAISVLRLVEQGALSLDQPVGDLLPAFDDLRVLDGFDGDTPILRPPSSRATVRQLLTHTSGLAYDIWNEEVTKYHAVTRTPKLQSGSRASFAVPLVSDPGTRFNYGTSMDWVGLIIEEFSGRPLQQYWAEEIFGPLGMRDTVVQVEGERRERTTPVHARDAEGRWQPTEIDFTRDPEIYAGGHCLYSTAGDFAAIQRLLLNGGAHGDVRLLRAETIAEMFRNQIGDLAVGTIWSADPAASEHVPLGARKWGLGILIDVEGVPGGRSAGSGGWMGGFNTFYWVDRDRGFSAALYTQTIPFFDDEVMHFYATFERAAYAQFADGDRRE